MRAMLDIPPFPTLVDREIYGVRLAAGHRMDVLILGRYTAPTADQVVNRVQLAAHKAKPLYGKLQQGERVTCSPLVHDLLTARLNGTLSPEDLQELGRQNGTAEKMLQAALPQQKVGPSDYPPEYILCKVGSVPASAPHGTLPARWYEQTARVRWQATIPYQLKVSSRTLEMTVIGKCSTEEALGTVAPVVRALPGLEVLADYSARVLEQVARETVAAAVPRIKDIPHLKNEASVRRRLCSGRLFALSGEESA